MFTDAWMIANSEHILVGMQTIFIIYLLWNDKEQGET